MLHDKGALGNLANRSAPSHALRPCVTANRGDGATDPATESALFVLPDSMRSTSRGVGFHEFLTSFVQRAAIVVGGGLM